MTFDVAGSPAFGRVTKSRVGLGSPLKKTENLTGFKHPWFKIARLHNQSKWKGLCQYTHHIQGSADSQ